MQVTFTTAGQPTMEPPRPKRAQVTPASVAPAPAPVTLAPSDVHSLESFLTFRGESRQLRHRIAEIERSVEGLPADAALAAAHNLRVHAPLQLGTASFRGTVCQCF